MRTKRLASIPLTFVLLLAGAAGGRGSAAEPAARHLEADSRPLVDPKVKPLLPTAFEKIDDKPTLGQIVERLGTAQRQTGSGLCIFAWRVTDGREFWVGTPHCDPSERPIYAKFR